MKIVGIPMFFATLVFNIQILAAEVGDMPPADLPQADREQLASDSNQFKADYKDLDNEADRLTLLKRWWSEKKVPAPITPNTPEQNAANFAEIAAALVADRTAINLQLRTSNAPAFKDLTERKVAFAKVIVFIAFVSDSKSLCLKLPDLFESDRARTDIIRDDYLSCLVANDLISQCEGAESLGDSALLSWKRFAKAPNPSLRMICLLALESTTQSATDRRAVLDEFIQEQNGVLIDMFIEKTSMLPLASRQELVAAMKAQNSSLSNAQKSRIDIVLAESGG